MNVAPSETALAIIFQFLTNSWIIERIEHKKFQGQGRLGFLMQVSTSDNIAFARGKVKLEYLPCEQFLH